MSLGHRIEGGMEVFTNRPWVGHPSAAAQLVLPDKFGLKATQSWLCEGTFCLPLRKRTFFFKAFVTEAFDVLLQLCSVTFFPELWRAVSLGRRT